MMAPLALIALLQSVAWAQCPTPDEARVLKAEADAEISEIESKLRAIFVQIDELRWRTGEAEGLIDRLGSDSLLHKKAERLDNVCESV